MSQYPQDADAIKRFSIEIAAAALDAIVPDPEHPGMRIAPSELKAYDAAVAVWDRMQLAGVSPPAFMKAIRLALASNGDLGDALVAAAHNSAPTPNGIATGIQSDPLALNAEAVRYGAESSVYFALGLGSGLAKGLTLATGLTDTLGITDNGNRLLDLLKANKDSRPDFLSLGGDQWALVLNDSAGRLNKVLGVFDRADVWSSEASAGARILAQSFTDFDKANKDLISNLPQPAP